MSIISHNEGLARQIVSAILDDMTNRAGLDGCWDDIHEEIKGEIIREWRSLAVAILEKK